MTLTVALLPASTQQPPPVGTVCIAEFSDKSAFGYAKALVEIKGFDEYAVWMLVTNTHYSTELIKDVSFYPARKDILERRPSLLMKENHPVTVYIAGPMSGLHQNNYPAFWLAANKFRAHGINVLNPADLQMLPNWSAYMRASLKMLASATHIHFLPGAENSRGALIEGFIANQLGIEIIEHPCTIRECEECEFYAWSRGPYCHFNDGLVCSNCNSRISEVEAQTACYNCHINAQEKRL